MTYGCDTSFLMRILTNHPAPLARLAIETAHSHIRNGDRFEISDLVLAEAYYALQASYGVAKGDALSILRRISTAEGFVVGSHAIEALATPNIEKASPGFVDHLIHGAYLADGKTTISCEKSFRKLPLSEVVMETANKP